MSVNIAANEQVWEAHRAAEFVSADVDATMATMTEDPVVLQVR
jgi:carboxymethylenebutenolidase